MAPDRQCATLQPGDRVVCLGDSITADPHGYVKLAREVLALPRPGAEVINAGVAGDTAEDMAGRFEHDVLARRPSWVTISTGGNDALQGVPVPRYEASMQSMVDAGRGAGLSIALCTPTPFEPALCSAPVDAVNARIAQYAAWVEAAAEGQGLLLIPMHAVFRLVQQISDPADPVCLTHDGVHMSPAGRYLMGLTFLAAFGVSLEPNVN